METNTHTLILGDLGTERGGAGRPNERGEKGEKKARGRWLLVFSGEAEMERKFTYCLTVKEGRNKERINGTKERTEEGSEEKGNMSVWE